METTSEMMTDVHFFDLPAELRIKIYRYVLLVENKSSQTPTTVIDLDPSNYVRVAPRLTLLRVSQRMHQEAYPIFYECNTFAILPQHGRFFYNARPLIARLAPHGVKRIKSLHLTLGQGWSKIPKTWKDVGALGLAEFTAARSLQIMVRCDPSAKFFDGFRGPGKDAAYYTHFSIDLVRQILTSMPWLVDVEIDAFSGVTKQSSLIQALSDLVVDSGRRLSWGPDISLIGEDKGFPVTVLSSRLDEMVGQMNAMHLAAQQASAAS